MKKIILIVILITSISCVGQNHQFENYINEFKSGTLPLIINRETSKSLFKYGDRYKQIPHSFIEKFIDVNFEDNNVCRYDYGIRVPWSNNLIALIVQKQNYEGESAYDLLETILIIYDKSGTILSKQVLGKDNDGWLSSVTLKVNFIEKTQAKLLEFDKEEMNCEIITYEFIVDPEGIVKLNKTNPTQKGKVVWDDNLHDFKLK